MGEYLPSCGNCAQPVWSSSREKDVQLWTWPPLYGEGGLWSEPCEKGKIHPDRVEAEGISGTRRQSRQASTVRNQDSIVRNQDSS